MLCGRLPFDDDHIPLLFKKINGELPFRSSRQLQESLNRNFRDEFRGYLFIAAIPLS
jgi:hypothetical protein